MRIAFCGQREIVDEQRFFAAFTPVRLKKCYNALYGAIGGVKSGRLTPEGALLRANADIFFWLKPNNRA